MAKILVVDDELGIRDLMYEILSDEGHTVFLAENAAEAREMKITGKPDIVLLDVWMPDTDGVSLLKEWVGSGQMDAPVIMMSGHATIETAVQATKLGAAGFLEKPITLQKLLGAVIDGLKIPTQRAWNSRAPMGGLGEQGFSASHGLGSRQSPFAPMSPHAGEAQGGQPSPLLQSHLASQSYATYEQQLAHGQLALAQQSATSAVSGQKAHQFTGGSIMGISMESPLREAREDFERIYFEYHLGRENGSMTKIAEKTGLERTHLYRKLKQLGLDASKAKRAMG